MHDLVVLLADVAEAVLYLAHAVVVEDLWDALAGTFLAALVEVLVQFHEELRGPCLDPLVLHAEHDLPEGLHADQLVVVDLELGLSGVPRDGASAKHQVVQRVRACDDLPVLLVDVDEVPLKAEVHLLREAASTSLSTPVVEPQQYLKEDHLQRVLLKQELTGQVVVAQCALRIAGLLGLLLHLVLLDLHCCEHLRAKDEELVSLLFAEGVDHEALPEHVDLLVLESLAVGLLCKELDEVKPSSHFLEVVELEGLVCYQRGQELPILAWKSVLCSFALRCDWSCPVVATVALGVDLV